MEKRYQVFISSTFQDLENARQEVSQALLRADCFPAGMELFPAADQEQFEFIKSVIDQSDYYIIITAGRYGSIHPETGLSYTEMEYDYAIETGIPVIRLLHKDPKSLADEGDEKLIKLLKFTTKLRMSRMVAFWETPDELGKEVVLALLDVRKRFPKPGWVRADHLVAQITGVVGKEVDSLEEQIEKVQEQIKSVRDATSSNRTFFKELGDRASERTIEEVSRLASRLTVFGITVASSVAIFGLSASDFFEKIKIYLETLPN